jgi:hypothetical protein
VSKKLTLSLLGIYMAACIYMLGVLKGCSNYCIFLYKKIITWEVLEEKIELFNIPLVVFQGVISCLAAFWVKRNTALCTYKSEYTL